MSEYHKVIDKEPEFSKFRAAVFPIQGNELKKFLPMGLMMFFILFNYTLLRNIKDVLIVTAPASGAEVISFVKLWGVMPCAILFFFIYLKLSNILSRENLFYACLIPFIVFFGAFALVIYPNKALLHPSHDSILALQSAYPNLKWFISLYGVWSYAIFYILSELWGSIVVSLLFWQFSNEITKTNEAKRFYSLFGLLGNVALIASGTTVEFVSFANNPSSGQDVWGGILTTMMMAVVAIGICIMLIYWWMNRFVLTNPLYYKAAKNINKKKEDKPKLSIRESLGYIFSSKYLGFITIIVFSYGVAANLVDVTWKSQIQANFPDSQDYFVFMGRFSYWTGFSTITLILLTKGVVRRFGWYTGAIITPLMLLITSFLFFSFVVYKDYLEAAVAFFGVTSIYMAMMIGATQNILTKGTKYSLFDPTKEMSYIPLNQELKVKGKAAVDVIGSRLGKSGGGFIQFMLLTITAGSQITIAPYLFGVIIVVILAWLVAVKGLSKLYKAEVIKQTEVS